MCLSFVMTDAGNGDAGNDEAGTNQFIFSYYSQGVVLGHDVVPWVRIDR